MRLRLMLAPCPWLAELLSGIGSNGISPCSNNFCSGFQNGSFTQWASQAGTEGYYLCLTAGQFSTQQEAGIAAENCAEGVSIATNSEYSGNLYVKNGKYSFTLPTTGDVDSSTWDPSAIPDGTVFAGDYHTHGGWDFDYYNEMFSEEGCNGGLPCDIGLAKSAEQQGQPMFLGTPEGRIEVFYPNLADILPFGCVLVGSAVPIGPGSSIVPVPVCH